MPIARQKHRPLDPRKCNIALDSNTLDRGCLDDVLIDRFEGLAKSGELNVVVAGGVRAEVQHPHTPSSVKHAVLPKIFNLRPGLNTQQHVERLQVAVIIQGNAKPGAHAADASHVSEAAETGCAYFITHDKRILSKRGELSAVLPPTLQIVTLLEFFTILDEYEHW
jgi:hypothetical protein